MEMDQAAAWLAPPVTLAIHATSGFVVHADTESLRSMQCLAPLVAHRDLAAIALQHFTALLPVCFRLPWHHNHSCNALEYVRISLTN